MALTGFIAEHRLCDAAADAARCMASSRAAGDGTARFRAASACCACSSPNGCALAVLLACLMLMALHVLGAHTKLTVAHSSSEAESKEFVGNNLVAAGGESDGKARDLRPVDCAAVEGGRLGDCELCEYRREGSYREQREGWRCTQCKAVQAFRLDEDAIMDDALELKRGLVIVNGTCVPCSELSDLRPASEGCDECIVTRNSRRLTYRCIAYSTKQACTSLSLHYCHECRETHQPGSFECRRCADGMTLLEGLCELKRKVEGKGNVLDAGALH